jgi:hypothetical protein
LDGTVEESVLGVAKLARYALGVGVDVALAAVLVLATGVEVDELLELLELPQPAITTATPTRARIDDLGTGDYLLSFEIGEDGYRAATSA